MKKRIGLSGTEFQILCGTAALAWFFVWSVRILFSHEWLSTLGLELFALSLAQPATVILGTVLASVVFQRVTLKLRWDPTHRIFKIVRFGILIAAVFLCLLAGSGVAKVLFDYLQMPWSYGNLFGWTVPLWMFLGGLGALGLVWLYPKRKTFVLAAGLAVVVVAGGLVIQRPAVVASFDAWWFEMLDSMRSWRNIEDSKVTIVTMPKWPGEPQYRRMLEMVVKSRPKVIGILAPVYVRIAESGSTAAYRVLPPDLTVYGVLNQPLLNQSYRTDFPVPRFVKEQYCSGIISGITSADKSFGMYEWGTSYVPVFEARHEVPYNEESMDVGLAIVGKYLGISSPMPVTRSFSLWSSGILHAAGRDVPLNNEGKVLINYPTRFVNTTYAFRYERDRYGSQFWVTASSPLPNADDTVMTFTKVFERLPDSLGYPHSKGSRYDVREGGIVRSETEYLNGNLIRKDTLTVEYIPEMQGRIVLITQQEVRTNWFAQNNILGITYASIIQNLLDKDFIIPLNDGWVVVFLLFTTSIMVSAFLRKKAVSALGIILGSTVVFIFVLVALLNWLQVYVSVVPVVAPCVVGLVLLFPIELARERRRLVEERTALSSELRAAQETQMGLMPTSDPSLSGFDISGLCRPAEAVGGDYFDYVWLNKDKTRLGIAIVDVSGKAMKAAMTAVMTSGMVYREIEQDQTPKVILREINRPMYIKTDKRIFTAMSFAVLDTKTNNLAFSNAGQMQPLLKRGGKVESLKVDGVRLPLGMAEDVEYKELTIALRSGDVMVFYTDGIPEAMNGKNEMFGFERLEAIVNESSPELSAKQVAARIVDTVGEFTGPTKRHDDMTVVVVRVL